MKPYDPFPPQDTVDRIAGAILRIWSSGDAHSVDLKEIATADRGEISDAVLRLRDYRFARDPAGVAIGMIAQELIIRREADRCELAEQREN